MPIRYVLDENLRGLLWKAILRHNAVGIEIIDAVRVGDLPDLPLGSSDSEILLWAEGADRVLVTRDKRTIATHLIDHLQSGHHSPGVFLLRRNFNLLAIVGALAYFAHFSDPGSWIDRIEYIP